MISLNNKLHSKKAAHSIELLIAFAAIISVVLVLVGPNGIFQNTISDVLTKSTDDMMEMADNLSMSRDDNTGLIAGPAVTTIGIVNGAGGGGGTIEPVGGAPVTGAP